MITKEVRRDGYYTASIWPTHLKEQLLFFTVASIKGQIYMVNSKKILPPEFIKEVFIESYFPFSVIPEV